MSVWEAGGPSPGFSHGGQGFVVTACRGTEAAGQATTDESGMAAMRLPFGVYRIRGQGNGITLPDQTVQVPQRTVVSWTLPIP